MVCSQRYPHKERKERCRRIDRWLIMQWIPPNSRGILYMHVCYNELPARNNYFPATFHHFGKHEYDYPSASTHDEGVRGSIYIFIKVIFLITETSTRSVTQLIGRTMCPRVMSIAHIAKPMNLTLRQKQRRRKTMHLPPH